MHIYIRCTERAVRSRGSQIYCCVQIYETVPGIKIKRDVRCRSVHDFEACK